MTKWKKKFIIFYGLEKALSRTQRLKNDPKFSILSKSGSQKGIFGYLEVKNDPETLIFTKSGSQKCESVYSTAEK